MVQMFTARIDVWSVVRSNNLVTISCDQSSYIVGLLGPVEALFGQCNYKSEPQRDQLGYVSWICSSTCRCPQKLLDGLANNTASNITKSNHFSFSCAIEGYERDLVPTGRGWKASLQIPALGQLDKHTTFWILPPQQPATGPDLFPRHLQP